MPKFTKGESASAVKAKQPVPNSPFPRAVPNGGAGAAPGAGEPKATLLTMAGQRGLNPSGWVKLPVLLSSE